MNVFLLTARAGMDGPPQRWGDIIDVSPAEAERMFKAGLARPVKQEQVETAMFGSGGVETAALPTPRNKHRS